MSDHELDDNCDNCEWCTPFMGIHSRVCDSNFMMMLMESIGNRPKPKKCASEEDPLPQAIEDKFAPYESLYELTLTTPTDDPYELRQFLDKITKSAMFSVKAYIACIELTKAGLPHIHALLFGNAKYMDASKIKKLKFPYRYELKRVRVPGRYHEYVNKERDNPIVIDYCNKKGIPQFWEFLN